MVRSGLWKSNLGVKDGLEKEERLPVTLNLPKQHNCVQALAQFPQFFQEIIPEPEIPMQYNLGK